MCLSSESLGGSGILFFVISKSASYLKSDPFSKFSEHSYLSLLNWSRRTSNPRIWLSRTSRTFWECSSNWTSMEYVIVSILACACCPWTFIVSTLSMCLSTVLIRCFLTSESSCSTSIRSLCSITDVVCLARSAGSRRQLVTFLKVCPSCSKDIMHSKHPVWELTSIYIVIYSCSGCLKFKLSVLIKMQNDGYEGVFTSYKHSID